MMPEYSDTETLDEEMLKAFAKSIKLDAYDVHFKVDYIVDKAAWLHVMFYKTISEKK